MKKILSLMLSCMMILSLLPQSIGMAEETEISYKTQTEYNVINQLEIFPQSVKDKLSSGEKISRAEYAKILYNIYYFTENIDTESENVDWKKEFFGEYYMDEVGELDIEDSSFDDLDNTIEFYNEVSVMNSMGYIHADGGDFKPEEPIKYVDALEAILKLMGADFYVNSIGGYPDGVMNYGASRDIYTMSERAEMSAMDVAKLIYTALDENVIKNAMVDSVFTYFEDDTTLMEKHLKLVPVQGIMSDCGTISLTDTKQGTGKVVIDGQVYNTALNCEEYLGQKVKAYVSIDDATKNEVKAIEYKKGNDVTVIDAKDIGKYENYVITYYENNRQRTIKLQANTLLVYNGEAKISWSDTDFDFESGSVKVIKNGGDYDVVIIEDYKNIMISSYNKEDNIIYNSAQDNDVYTPDASYDLTAAIDAERLTVIKADGEIGTVEDITPGIAAGIIYNGTYAKIICYDKVENGVTITTVDTSNDEYNHYFKIETADADYYVAESFLSALNTCTVEMGKAYTLYFDNNGNIVWISSEYTRDVLVGYLMKAMTDDEENGLLKVLKEDGSIMKLSLAETVKYTTDAGVETRIKQESIKLKLDNEYPEGIFAYKVNAEGKIKEIEIPRATSTDEEVLQKFFISNDARPDTGKATYKNQTTSIGSFGYMAFVNASSKIFQVPVSAANKQIDTNYSVISKSSIKGDTSYDVMAYNFDNESSMAPYIVLKNDVATSFEYRSANTVFVLVNKITKGLDSDNETCKVISGTLFGYNQTMAPVKYYAAYDQVDGNGAKVTALDIAGDTVMSVDEITSETNTYEIQRGDIIRVILDIDGEHIEKAELFYGINRPNLDFGGAGRLGWLAGTVSSSVKTGWNDYYVDKGYTNPFAVNYSGGNTLYTSVAYRKTIMGGWKAYSGYVYNYADGVMELTTKDLTQSSAYDKTSQDYYTAWYLPMSKGTTIVVDGDDYTASASSTSDIKSYKNVGARDCSRVIMLTLDGNDRYMIIINE